MTKNVINLFSGRKFTGESLAAYSASDSHDVKVCKHAANLGDADAQYDLGISYAEGDGVLQDYKEAVKWYTRAAKQGDAGAQYNLGVMYSAGQGVSQDYEKAVEWYEKSAEQGNASAQSNLGIMRPGSGMSC